MKKLLSEIIKENGDGYIDEEAIAELLAKTELQSVYDLKRGDTCYVIQSHGTPSETEWAGAASLLGARDIGNVVLGHANAIKEIERRKCETILLRYGHREHFVTEDQYYLVRDVTSTLIHIAEVSDAQPQGAIYFDSLDLCTKAVVEAGVNNVAEFLFNIAFDRASYTYTDNDNDGYSWVMIRKDSDD